LRIAEYHRERRCLDSLKQLPIDVRTQNGLLSMRQSGRLPALSASADSWLVAMDLNCHQCAANISGRDAWRNRTFVLQL
jgi:hypothetical protein